MKKIRALFVIALLLLSLTGLFACKKGKESAPAEQIPYYVSVSPAEVPTSAEQISLGGYTFRAFFEGRAYIKVSETREDITYYGVLDDRGEVVIPVRYKEISMNGDFFLAEGTLENELYHVFSRTGRELLSSGGKLTATDVGGGVVRITEGSNVYLYDEGGTALLEGSSLDDSYAFSACGSYLLAKSAKRNKTFLFDRKTGDLRGSFLGMDGLEYAVHYAGGDDFIVIRNEQVGESLTHTVLIRKSDGDTCLRQTVTLRNLATGETKELSLDRPILSLSDRYSVGMTEEARRNYPLNEGYFVLCYYVTKGKTTDGSYAYCLADRSLRVVKELPEGLSPLLSMREGRAVTVGASGKIYLLDETLSVLLQIDDAAYQAVSYSCGLINASKLVDGRRVMGCFDVEGRVVIPFEYDTISSFVGGKAYAAKNGEVYLLDREGNARSLGQREYAAYWYWDGFYETEEGGRVGLTSYDGKVLIPADYDAFESENKTADCLFVAMRIGSVVDVFVLR